jgi:hypothetical protein
VAGPFQLLPVLGPSSGGPLFSRFRRLQHLPRVLQVRPAEDFSRTPRRAAFLKKASHVAYMSFPKETVKMIEEAAANAYANQ